MKKEFLFRLILVFGIAVLLYQTGIKPMLGNEFYLQSRKGGEWAAGKLPKENGVYDVVVVGEEPEGIAAAVSSARVGAKTLLISSSEDLGGVIVKGLQANIEVNRNKKNGIIDRGIFYELHDKLYGKSGKNINIENYDSVMNKLVKDEKNLDVVLNAKIDSPVIENNVITGITISTSDGKKTYNGKRFIDATRDGKVLLMCGVPYITGSEDLNMKNTFMPVTLNFELKGVDWSAIKSPVTPENSSKFYSILSKYELSHINMRISDFSVIDQGNNTVIIQGLEVLKLDTTNEKAVESAYKDGVAEAKEFANYLKTEFTIFKDSQFFRCADEFYISEARHFKGEYVLGVSDILENRDFHDKIALGVYPVEAGKFSDTNDIYVVGKPDQYSVPLGCIIPLNIDNLLMAGNKISYSSLAASSAGTMGTSITTGESAGVVAVYSLLEGMTPREIVKKKDVKQIDALERLLKRQGIYLPEFSIKNKNADNWSYTAVRQLASLGLIAGGVGNDYRFKDKGKQEDLTTLLLNGILRVSPDKYSLEFDARIRRYFVKDKLTKDAAGRILTAFNGSKAEPGKAYEKACELGYIDSAAQLELKQKTDLTMDDVYYLAARNIMQYGGQSQPK